ncbi:MAG TPA: hypothetical protein VN766_06385 [Stellaceae bacterium]|jgi:hypothetical protein|nr:hypothetical protein [Stellaceae bacterium]
MEDMILAYPALAAMTLVASFLAVAARIERLKEARLAAARSLPGRHPAARPVLFLVARSGR